MNNGKLNLNPAGPAFEELTLEEMVASQGSGDVKPQTTATIVQSSAACAQTIKTTVSIVHKKC